jgi:hypothetical protein
MKNLKTYLAVLLAVGLTAFGQTNTATAITNRPAIVRSATITSGTIGAQIVGAVDWKVGNTGTGADWIMDTPAEQLGATQMRVTYTLAATNQVIMARVFSFNGIPIRSYSTPMLPTVFGQTNGSGNVEIQFNLALYTVPEQRQFQPFFFSVTP